MALPRGACYTRPMAAHPARTEPVALFEAMVTQDCKGQYCYRTITEALEAASAARLNCYTSNWKAVIRLEAGIYREKLNITIPNLTLLGHAAIDTVIVYGDHHGALDSTGNPLGTGNSATCTIRSEGFCARNITFANDFDYPRHALDSSGDSAKRSGLQAVALRTTTGCDRARFADCRFTGWQDTLYVDAGRCWFESCTIAGLIDFIFGGARSVFSMCTIVSRPSPQPGRLGYICAPSTKASEPFGFLFEQCSLVKEHGSVAPGSVWLGRPWHPSGDPTVIPSAIFFACHMEDHITAQGWTSMHSRTKDGVQRQWEPWEARFFEAGSTGAGSAAASATRRLLDCGQGPQWIRQAILGDWDPAP